jgi:hypothetical protein
VTARAAAPGLAQFRGRCADRRLRHLSYTLAADPTGANYVGGELTSSTTTVDLDRYCDERAVVERCGGKIIVGSDANGGSRNGQRRRRDLRRCHQRR